MCLSVIKTPFFSTASASLSPCFSNFFLNDLPETRSFSFLCFLILYFLHTQVQCLCQRTYTNYIRTIYPCNPGRGGPPTPRLKPQSPPKISAPGRRSARGTAGRPPSSLKERARGWRTGLTPVRWWSGSQVENICPSGESAAVQALTESGVTHA